MKRHLFISILVIGLIFVQNGFAQGLGDIDITLADATTLKDNLEVSFDVANSLIGIKLKKPALELLMQKKYGNSFVKFSESEVVHTSEFWQTFIAIFTFHSIVRTWQEDNIKSLQMDGNFDVANQSIPIKFDAKSDVLMHYWEAKWYSSGPSLVPIPGMCSEPAHIFQAVHAHFIEHTRYDLLTINNDVTGKMIPKVVSGDFVFEMDGLTPSNTVWSGPLKNTIDLFTLPLYMGPTPVTTLQGLYGFTHWTQLFDGIVADKLEDKNGVTNDPGLTKVKNWVNQYFTNLFAAQGNILDIHSTHVDADGLWIYFSYDAIALKTIFENFLVTANNLGVIKDVNKFLQAQNKLIMDGFDLSKINASQDKLIISLSGAAVYPQLLVNKKEPLQTYTTSPVNPIPTYGDGIYPLPANYVDSKTVAVVGAPWPMSTLGTINQPDLFCGPDPVEFAAKIKVALSQMAPDSKLILLGKSMGGCKMQKISEALKDINVPVELLIIVDGSCTPADQSGEVKDVFANVKRVYNFRQTMAPPVNDNQNGFQLGWSSPTIGQDLVVSDENIATPMCAGVGHDEIDECAALLAEIDRIIRGVKSAPALAKLSISTRNEGQNENNIIKPRMYVQNTGSVPVSNFKVYSYFSVEDGKTPVVVDYYTPYSTPSLEKIGINDYRLVYDFIGTILQSGQVVPNLDGNVLGLRYSDWLPMDKNLNYTYSTSAAFIKTEKMDVKLNDGSYIFGNVPVAIPDPVIPAGTVSISGITTVVVPPNGITVRIKKPEFLHGLMFTVRNAGQSDYTEVKWQGVLDQNRNDCQLRTAKLSGNGAQINNICTPKDSNGEMSFELKSQNSNTYSVIVDIYEWSNGTGCNP